MTRIKICGITSLDDALAASRFGADALGFNFYRKSPRYISPTDAGKITDELGNEISKVGVFVDAAPDEIANAAEAAGLDAVQLHGDEAPETVAELRRRTGSILIKAFRVDAGFEPNIVRDFETDFVLLDGFSAAEFGGSGSAFDWDIAIKVREMGVKLYLAGGLGPQNVADAVQRVRPFGVDACSGLESSKGKKDHSKMKQFIDSVRTAK